MGEKGIATTLGAWTRNTLGSPVIWCPEVGGFLLIGAAARHLKDAEWEHFVARAVEAAAAARQEKAPRLDAETRHAFLSAAGWICTRNHDDFGTACPIHGERAALNAILGGQTMAEFLASVK